MPAPTKATIKAALRAALVAKKNSDNNQLFVKRVDGNPVSGVLPEHMDEFVDALADGITTFWTAWQLNQTVTILPPPLGAVIDTVTFIVALEHLYCIFWSESQGNAILLNLIASPAELTPGPVAQWP